MIESPPKCNEKLGTTFLPFFCNAGKDTLKTTVFEVLQDIFTTIMDSGPKVNVLITFALRRGSRV